MWQASVRMLFVVGLHRPRDRYILILAYRYDIPGLCKRLTNRYPSYYYKVIIQYASRNMK